MRSCLAEVDPQAWLAWLNARKTSRISVVVAATFSTLLTFIALWTKFVTRPQEVLLASTAADFDYEDDSHDTLHPFQLRPKEHKFRGPGIIRQAWTITSDYRRPDGVLKQVYLINDAFPGPILEARDGDRVVVEVKNRLQDENVSIHWHGISMRGFNCMDGAAGITQKHIEPGANFTYDFTIEPSQHGTFFYHAHDGVQRADGLYGGLVVHEPLADTAGNWRIKNGCDEHLLLIGDWYHRSAQEALDFYMHPGSFGNEPVPDSLLVNGEGIFTCEDAVPARTSDCRQRQDNEISPIRLSVARWTKLRLVNAGSYAAITFSAPGFLLQPLAVDGGNEIEMRTGQSVGPLQPGERLDIRLVPCKNNSLEGSFDLMIRMDESGFKYPNPALTTVHRIIGEWTQLNLAKFQPELEHEGKAFEHLDLSAVKALSSSIPQEATMTLVLYAITQKLAHLKNVPHGFINSSYWQPQESPPLPLIDLPRNRWDEHQFVPHIPYSADSPLWVDIVLNNLDEESHPFHLHGYDFHVLSTYSSTINWGSYNPFEDDEPPGGAYELKRAVKKDTVLVPRRGYAVLRLLADNPGLWMLHCHVLWHQASGMAMAIDVS